MSFTETFRRQHNELLQLVKEISNQLSLETLQKDAKEVRSLLSNLSGKISIHLAVEDNSLYPRLLEHESPEIRALAKKYIDEMGNIKEVFSAYSKKWYSTTDIQNNPAEFIKETKNIFEALGKRIDKENNELYDLVDKL